MRNVGILPEESVGQSLKTDGSGMTMLYHGLTRKRTQHVDKEIRMKHFCKRKRDCGPWGGLENFLKFLVQAPWVTTGFALRLPHILSVCSASPPCLRTTTVIAGRCHYTGWLGRLVAGLHNAFGGLSHTRGVRNWSGDDTFHRVPSFP